MSILDGLPRRRGALTVSAGAVALHNEGADLNWKHLLNGIGLGEGQHGDLPGYHFQREPNDVAAEGVRLEAWWASGGGGLSAIVRRWRPEHKSFVLEIVNPQGSVTRRYYWQVEPISEGRSSRQLQVEFFVPFRITALLRLALMWPLKGKIARDAVNFRF